MVMLTNASPKNLNFDTFLLTKWDEAERKNIFRFIYEILTPSKHVGKNIKFLLQLNAKRAFERREPQFLKHMHEPFDSTKFNFTKIQPDEILIKFYTESTYNAVIINASPLAHCNVLLVPRLTECLPQRLDYEAISFALEFLGKSHPNRKMRLAYNSQLACASVNHLHIHAFYLPYTLYTELDLPLEKLDCLKGTPFYNCVHFTPRSPHDNSEITLPGLCFVIKELHATDNNINNGFCINNGKIQDYVNDKNNCLVMSDNMSYSCDNGEISFENYPIYGGLNTLSLQKGARMITQFIDFLEQNSIPHNLFATWAYVNNQQLGIKCYVWPRKPNFHKTCSTDINVAACEIAGHLIIKDEEQYKNLDETSIKAIFTNYSYPAALINEWVSEAFTLSGQSKI